MHIRPRELSSTKSKFMTKPLFRPFFVFILLLISFDAYNCSCIKPILGKSIESADYVFRGKIKSIRSNIFFNRQTIKIEVIKDYKGRIDKKYIYLRSTYFSATCGLSLSKNVEYVIYANQKNGVKKYIYGNRCSRTRKYTAKEENMINEYLTQKKTH